MAPSLITSLHNPLVKNVVRLRTGRHRAKQGRFVIDGAREIRRALEANVDLTDVFVCEPLCQSDDRRQVLAAIGHTQAQRHDVTPEVLDKLSYGQRNEGMLAVASAPRRNLADLRLPENALLAVLEAVEKPGNVGAVLRSADAAGVHAVVVADPHTDLYNPNTIRASLGTVFTMQVVAASAEETLRWLREGGVNVYAARVDGQREYTEVDLTRPAALVLGSEAEGISDVWRAGDVTGIRLPMQGRADSLNVSATAAVLFYEAQRQRRKGPMTKGQ